VEREGCGPSGPAALFAPRQSLIGHLGQLLTAASLPHQQRVQERYRRHLLLSLLCWTRRTITGVLCTGGQQDQDWTADYQLYRRVSPAPLFALARGELLRQLPPEEDLLLAMDDTVVKKRGKKIPGTAYRADPQSPPFATNLLWGQRWLMLSGGLLLPASGAVRMVPLGWEPCPTPRKPRKNAPAEAHTQYRTLAKAANINLRALDALQHLRQTTPRRICVLTDGRFGNGTMLKHLPEGIEQICRIRSDARLYGSPPGGGVGARGGRPRCYGPALPTPEQILKDDQTYPWQPVRMFAAGSWHQGRAKIVRGVKWKAAGGQKTFVLVVIAPLGYRLSQGGKLCYRDPAYLLCTDNRLELEQIVQRYVARWDIEVNIREVKSLIGAGEAMVRDEVAAVGVPQSRVAAYSLLLLAAARCWGPETIPTELVPPKWRRQLQPQRPSTNLLLNHLRYEVLSLGYWLEGFGGFPDNLKVAGHPSADSHNGTKPLLDPNHPLFHVIAA
jgi:hypothetical protein